MVFFLSQAADTTPTTDIPQ